MGSGIGLYGGDPIGSKALTDLGIEAVQSTTGQVTAANFGQGLAANATPRAFRAAGRFASETGIVGVDDFGRPIEVAPDPPIDADTANKEFGIPGVLKFSGPTTRDAARDLYEHHRDELLRQDVINRGTGGIVQGALGIGANLTAGLLDPLNLAVGFIPIAGEARVAQLLGRAAGRIGEAAAPAVAEAAPSIAARVGERFGLPLGTEAERTAAETARLATGAATATEGEAALTAMTAPQRALLRGGLGGAQGAVQMGALQPLEYALSKGEQEDYTMADALRSIALGTVIGGGMHAGVGAIIDRATGRYRNPISQALEEAGPDARQGLLQGTLGQTIDGQPVNVKPFLDLVPNPMRLGEAGDEIRPGIRRYPLMRDDTPVGTAEIVLVNDGKAAIANIVDAPRQLGLPEMRGLARQFFEAHPEVDEIRGFRAGREVGTLTRDDVMRPAPAAPPPVAMIDEPLALLQRGELNATRAAEIADWTAQHFTAETAPEHLNPEMWAVVARNLQAAESSREGGVSVVADQMRYMPADGVPKTASEREAVAVIARAMDAEAVRGGDLAAFRADADAAYRAAGHGEPPDLSVAETARSSTDAQAAAATAPPALEGGIAGVEYRKLVAQGVPEEEARAQAALRQARYEARSAAYPELGTAEELYRRDAPETVTAEAGELAEGELGQAPNETKGHPEGDVEDAAWRRIEPEKTSTGKYRGAPAWVTNGRRLGQLRRLIQQLIEEGVTGRFWYEDSAKKILQITRGNLSEAEKFTGLLAIYSPQTAVFVNTQFAIKAFAQWKRGEPINVKTGAQDIRAQAWLDRGEDWGGRKTNNFYLNMMHELITEHPEAIASLNLPADVLTKIRGATVDLWVLRAMGHDVDSAGGEGLTNKYGFSEKEIQRAAGWLNKDLAVGERRWLPHQVQAALWSAVKARYELPAVKEATWAESLKKGFAKMLPDEDGKLQRTSPQKAGDDRVGHMAVWRKHALAASKEDVATQIADARGSFSDAIDRIAQNVTGEAVPSASFGHAINDASPEAKRQFTHDALQLLIDDDGNDVLAAQLGVNLNFNHIGAGLFEGNINPTVVTTLVPEKPPGFFDKSKAQQYARAWQYIFKQDAVPIFRADPVTDFAGDYAAHSASGTTLKRFDTQAEAQAFADERSADRPKQDGKPKRKGQPTTISGGKFALGLKLEFAQDLDESTLRRLADALSEELGPDAGFTKTGARDVAVINYRGANGLPDINDVQFANAIDRIVARDDIDVSKVSHFGSEGEYGPVHDWKSDPTASSLSEAAGGRPDFQSWLADRAAAFDALLEKWRDPESANAAAIAERDRIAGTGATEPRPGGEPGAGPSTTGPPELEQAGRGKIRLATEDAKALITRYRDAADASTLIHEDFHQWTRELFDDAARPDAPPQIVADAATLRREVGAEPGQPLTVEQLEQLAQWGEQYLREGKAPTPELQGVFDRFKAWLTEIYKTIVDLGIPLNDEVRGVYGRMLSVPEREAGAGDAASFRTEPRATEVPPVAAETAARPAGEPRPTDTLAELNAHAAELEGMRQRMLPDERLSPESRAEIQAAREAVTEAEGQASALERAAFCISRG